MARNYRLISLTSIACKTMEAIVKDGIIQHLEANNLLSLHQHTFQCTHSCTMQLLEVMDGWMQMIEEGQPLDEVYLNFQKGI